MEITSRQAYAASPADVHAMMTDPAYLEAVCQRGGATRQSVRVEGDTTHISMDLPAPDMARRFVGDVLTVNQTVEWGAPAADGSRTGTLTATVEKMPVEMTGRANLTPSAAGTDVAYLADLKVNIPLLGRKLEQAAAPSIRGAIDVQQVVGNEYLANR